MSDMVPEVLNAALDSLFTPKEPGELEYKGEDGLLYCRSCHMPVQCRVNSGAKTRWFPAFADASRKRWRRRNARMSYWSGSVKSGS